MSRRYSSSSVVGVIFGMALEEDEQALPLLHERVDARVLRPRQHAIAARQQGLLRYLVPPRVRHLQTTRSGGGQGMIRDAHALEDAEALVAERPPGDAVDVQNARVRRQARQDGRVRVVCSAHSSTRVRLSQYGSSSRSAARGSVPVTMRPSMMAVPQVARCRE